MMDPIKIEISTGVDAKLVSQLPKLTLKEWKKLAATKPRLITEATKAAALQAHDEASKKNLAALLGLYESIPSRLEIFGGPRANPAPELTFLDEKEKPHSVRGLNRDAMVHDALVARALLSSRTNQAQVYASALAAIRKRAEKNPDVGPKLKALPAAFEVDKFSVKDIDQGIATLIDIARVLLNSHVDQNITLPPGRPATCGQEEGTGDGGDSTGVDPSKPLNPNGLLQNKNWPLKFFTTCIRNQMGRGTCPSFSTIAAMEACIAVKTNRWVNLSEQDLYKHQKHDWFPFDDYSEGFVPPLSLLFQLLTGYRFPWERDWNYNPSTLRLDDTTHHTYSHSCDLYNNPNCSDTNHQSHKTCYQIDKEVQHNITKTVSKWVQDFVTVVDDVVDFFSKLLGVKTHVEIWGHWVEQTVTQVVTDIVTTTVCVYDTSIAGTSGFGITSATVFWDPFTNGQVGISLAKLFLANRVPVIYCMWGMPSFWNCATNGGYVMYAGPNEPPPAGKQVHDTGHCVCITGFIDNADLPPGAPAGSGGGYFIIKNSRGTDFGDCGFAYAPYDWVLQWGQVMCTINSITP
jgi:hypothetical protein